MENRRFINSSGTVLAMGLSALLLASTAFGTVTGDGATLPSENDNRLDAEGLSIEMSIEPVRPSAGGKLREGEPVKVRFQITDSHTGAPISGVYPAAWMDRIPHRVEEPLGSCTEKVQSFIAGSLLSPPELDLNVYYVLSLNNDATISVVDPLFGFGTTKLLDMIFLDSPGEDWALADDQGTLFVAMPEVGKVAVADTAVWEVTKNLEVGPRPTRMAIQPDGRYVWVGYEGDGSDDSDSGVAVIDVAASEVVKRLRTGSGFHDIAFDADSRFAYVTNAASGTVTVVDARELETLRDVEVGGDPTSIQYTALAKAVYVVSSAAGTITVLDGESHQVMTRMTADPGLGALRFAPGGKLGFLVNPVNNELYILDTSHHRIVQSGEMESGPDQVTFTEHLAYVRHRGTEIVLMVPLEEVGREGQPIPVVDFPGGHAPFGQGVPPSPADGIVQAPGATAVLVANPADKAIYFYKEGMAAPMGHFQNYGRQPRAVLAVDRSLEEREPGVYETTAVMQRPGRYDVAFFLDSPRTIHCFDAAVYSNPELETQRAKTLRLELQLENAEERLVVGENTTLRFRLVNARTKDTVADAGDLKVLTFRPPGLDQVRQWARRVEAGLYEVDLTAQMSGHYFMFFESADLGVALNQSRYVVLRAEEAGTLDTTEATGP